MDLIIPTCLEQGILKGKRNLAEYWLKMSLFIHLCADSPASNHMLFFSVIFKAVEALL